MTFDEFKEFYEIKGYLPNDIVERKNKLNEKQLKTRYTKYKKNFKNKNFKVDEEWEKLKTELDLTKCNLLKHLKEDKLHEEIKKLFDNGNFLLDTIDPAHIFSRSGYPFLKYDKDNVVPLNRFSHSCLDTMRDPITGEPITKEQHKLYWVYISGIERFERLEEKIKKYVIRNGTKEASEKI